MISVITPNFNRAHTIGETLASLVAQTSPEWECVVVDDGSTDTSAEVVEEFVRRDSRIRWHERGRDPKGACTCRNIGVDLSLGEHVMFLDSDDTAAPWCIEQRISVANESSDADIIVFPAMMFTAHPGDEDRLWNVMTADDVLARFLRLDSPWQGTGPLWRKNAFTELGGWRESLACWQDIDLSIRALASGLSHVVRYDLRPDVYIRRGDGTTVSSGNLRSPAKLRSKKFVLEEALAVATGNVSPAAARPDQLNAVREMGFAVANDHMLGREELTSFRIWARMIRSGILDFREASLSLVHLFLLAPIVRRFPFARQMSARIVSRYARPLMIGTHSISAT